MKGSALAHLRYAEALVDIADRKADGDTTAERDKAPLFLQRATAHIHLVLAHQVLFPTASPEDEIGWWHDD